MNIDKIKYPNCSRGHIYAMEVLEGKITACQYVIGACERYLDDINNKQANFYMDWEYAEKYLRLVQKFEHVIGNWKTKEIIYEPWQCFNWMNIVGFKLKATRTPRYRIAHLEVARGNAKSAMASQAVLYFLALDNPNGNQISTIATKKDQARIVLDSSRAMAEKNKSFLSRTGVRVLMHSITHKASNSVARALASEAKGLDGLNDRLAVVDELHAVPRDVFELITSGMSKRTDSLVLCITTAGADTTSVGYSQSAYAKKICLGEVNDDTFYACVYTLDEDDQWDDESCWIKANPNLGVSVDIATFRSKVEKAKITPADVPNIKIKHLNIWTSEASQFYNQLKWDTCSDKNIKLIDFANERGKMGLDLASHIDITSMAMIFKREGRLFIFDKSYLPEETLRESKNVFYDECVAGGWLIETKGAAINYDFIREEAEGLVKTHRRIEECFYDEWNATETAQKLSHKIEMVKMKMNVANLSEPMKKLDAFTRQGKIVHNGSPLLRWCLGNVVAKEDHNGNVYPRKPDVRLKIDPIIAILMALAGWLQEPDSESVYEERGIRRL